jgi:hypothetical protein
MIRLETFRNVYVTTTSEKSCKLLSVGEGDLSPRWTTCFFMCLVRNWVYISSPFCPFFCKPILGRDISFLFQWLLANVLLIKKYSKSQGQKFFCVVFNNSALFDRKNFQCAYNKSATLR